jgi:hypothetical protein
MSSDFIPIIVLWSVCLDEDASSAPSSVHPVNPGIQNMPVSFWCLEYLIHHRNRSLRRLIGHTRTRDDHVTLLVALVHLSTNYISEDAQQSMARELHGVQDEAEVGQGEVGQDVIGRNGGQPMTTGSNATLRRNRPAGRRPVDASTLTVYRGRAKPRRELSASQTE